MFVDHIRIHAKAGDGGNGIASFRRAKFEPKGGPDGGDGGKGGDIILRVETGVDNLTALFYEPLVKAQNGRPGQHQQKTGRSGKATIVPVPVGTIVYRLPEGATLSRKAPVQTPQYSPNTPIDLEAEDEATPAEAKPVKESELDLELVADLTEPGTEFILCHGGKGGRGNVHFKSSVNRTPRQYREGEPGEEGYFYLELRKIADIGLVGYPNAGKSTLLSRLSAATPKVAPYPFTTLTPHIGVVENPDAYERLAVADIPGLIEGASENVGLGHDFLRHIVRCKALCLVVDTSGLEGREPVADIRHIRRELDLYDPSLSARPWLIAANKIDLPESREKLGSLRQAFPKIPLFPIAAERSEGLEPLVDHFFALTNAARQVETERDAEDPTS